MKSGCRTAVATAMTLLIGFKQKTKYWPSSKKNPNPTLWATTDIKLAFHDQRGEYMITTKVSASEIENSLTTDPSRTLRMPPFPEVIEGRKRLAREIHDT